MFLTKKNAAYLNKPPKGKVITPRVLPGWGDDDQGIETYNNDYSYEKYNQPPKANQNLLDDTPSEQTEVSVPPSRQTGSKKLYFNWDQLNQMNNIQCEKKLVENIVEPGGIRIKPNDNMLTEFLKECRNMQPPIIGSLLLSKIEVNYPFQVKAKSLYTIEYLVKKNTAFSNYFKTQTQRLQQFPQPEDNVENYRKILKNTLTTIGVVVSSEAAKEQNVISFEDPGYNDPKEESQVRGFMKNNEKTKKVGGKKFISPNQSKKVMQGPGAKKQQETFDIFGNSEKQSNQAQNSTGLENLLNIDEPKENNSKFTFDDLLGQTNTSKATNNSNNAQFDFTL